jgi:hypothetical protein
LIRMSSRETRSTVNGPPSYAFSQKARSANDQRPVVYFSICPIQPASSSRLINIPRCWSARMIPSFSVVTS